MCISETEKKTQGRGRYKDRAEVGAREIINTDRDGTRGMCLCASESYQTCFTPFVWVGDFTAGTQIKKAREKAPA